MAAEKDQSHSGVVVPMVSPFTDQGAIDEVAVKRIVAHLASGRLAGVFVLGTTGEAMSIHPRQCARLVECAAERVDSRMKLYAGISGNCLRESIEAARLYKRLGADALVAHPPFYYPISDQDLEEYFRRLADAVPLPLLLYNIPQTTHVSIPMEVVAKLSHHPNIAGIKDSAKEPERMTQLLRAFGHGRIGNFSVLAGFSGLFTLALRLGVDGLVPSGANLEPRLYQKMYEAGRRKKWTQVEQLQEQTDAVSKQYVAGRLLGESLAVLKALMAARKLCSRAVLPPLQVARVQTAA